MTNRKQNAKIMYKAVLILFSILLFNSNLKGQERKVNFGLNFNPEFFLEVHLEGIALVNISPKINSKISIGYTHSNDNFGLKTRCLIVDPISNRKVTGWFTKLSVDYAVFKLKKINFYSGPGLIYSNLKTSGLDKNDTELNKSGDIFSAGFKLGARRKIFTKTIIDIGIETYFYGKDQHQIDPICKGTIPGIGESNSGDILFSWFIHVLL